MKKIYLTMVLCLFAIGGWAQEDAIVTPEDNEVNSGEYKSAVLQYFDITDEEWEEIGYDAGESLDFEFIGDTLHITGFLDLNCYNYQIGCTIHDGKIDVTVYPTNVPEDDEQPNCMVLRRAEAKIPGFKEGTYQIAFRGQAPVEAVCGENSSYRPFVEDGKVWTVRGSMSGLEEFLVYYYFDGDTIVGGRPCKRMIRRYDPNSMDFALHSEEVGSFYEEGKRVYCAFSNSETFVLLYDFGAEKGDTIEVHAGAYANVAAKVSCAVVSKGTGVADSFKGCYTQVMAEQPKAFAFENIDTWMEGVGGFKAPHENVLYGLIEGNYNHLMACTVGDELLFIHPDWEPDVAGKKRIDFTHVVKTKPKSPRRKAESASEETLSGEYNNHFLDINLGTLRNAYSITIANPAGEEVYTKEVKANQVMALHIDISTYAREDYTVTLENSEEIFMGLLSRSKEVSIMHPTVSPAVPQPSTPSFWHDLTGRPVKGHLQKGIYIQDGRKILVK